MTKKITEKYNNACIKIFKLIIMLYEDKAYFKDVIELISDGNYDGTSNTHVTLNKYLNALKIFGINVKKVKNKYHLLSPFEKIDFNQNDIESIKILKDVANRLPDSSTTKKNFNSFIKNLELRMDEKTLNAAKLQNNSTKANNQFLNYELIEQIKLCEKYCNDKLKLEIEYTNQNNIDVNIICTPIETLYLKRQICLKAIGNNGSRIYEIPIKNIKRLKQLPSKGNTNLLSTTIVYKLKNRLAKNYRLRDWEKLEETKSDGSIIIVNKEEDFNILLKRLMKYGTECEIISPKFIKEEMINLINKTLSNYE